MLSTRQPRGEADSRRAACVRSLNAVWSAATKMKPQNKKAAEAAFMRKLLGLESANVLCLPAFLSFGHSEFNRLAIL